MSTNAASCHQFLEGELRNSQRELLLQQVRLESIIQFSEDAIVTKNLQGIIQSWNPSAQRIFGYTPSEVIGKPIHLIIPPELQDEETEILSKISRGERVEHLETERLAKCGKRLYISVTSSPIKDPDGNIIGAIKIARDVTERRQHLSKVEEANRIKDQFLATLSHELRTPLNAILGWAQLASKNLLDPARVKEGLAIIERNARSQAQIIEDLLDVNRIVSGTIHLETQSLVLEDILNEAIESITPAAQVKNIKLDKSFDCEACSIVADPNRMKQVIWNLLTNAVKFTGKGGQIKIGTTKTNSKVNLTISDNGEGIAPEFLPYIFDRFSQADTSSARRYGGLGLGLSIVRHLIKLHGGEITAQSEGRGKGASFTVTLPLSVFKFQLTGQPRKYSQDSFKGLHALIVDDEPDARKLLKTLLQDHGANVLAAKSSVEALDLCQAEDFDLIVSDIGMPNEDGYQFIRKLRKLPNQKSKLTPAIALTAYARTEDRIQALEAGFQMHVPKPIEPSELVAVIKSITRQKYN